MYIKGRSRDKHANKLPWKLKESIHQGHARISLFYISRKDIMDGCSMTRRKSYDTSEKDDSRMVKGFPRRSSLTAAKPSLLTRRRSEVTLREIQEGKKTEERKKSVLFRQYSTISAPKIISERQVIEKAVSKIDATKEDDDLELPRIPSVTPEPLEIRLASQCRDREAFNEKLKNGSYRPKRCWCFRCQLMYSMFKAGDDRLEMWGNYPCLKR
ncbi:uncharacterized protein LOC123562839 [Mercenaria mercenaria]|uniref:uncharacterized protein LOC123562839 n=1 Tax=Mercenaria mercenaria TaxID=6596 RepID=UPI001E1D2C8C|nr:uncharacterized protein LOC123562839 [Mercenaria mercenaria]